MLKLKFIIARILEPIFHLRIGIQRKHIGINFKSNIRRKIFYIKSQYLGDVSATKELELGAENYLSKISDYSDPFEFFRLMFRTIRVALLKEGINIDPLLHQAGNKVGEDVYNDLKGENIDELMKNIAEFWQRNKLGRIEVESVEPLVINAYDCFECEDLPKIGRSACAFDSGIFEAVFTKFLGYGVDADEVKSYAKGDDYCSFVIKSKDLS